MMMTINMIRELAEAKVDLYQKTQELMRLGNEAAEPGEKRRLAIEWEVEYADFMIANNKLNAAREEYAKQTADWTDPAK